MNNRKLLPFILPLVLASLLVAIWAGWIRIGWTYPLSLIAGKHGALMVGSFLGTLISLERAVVIKNRWAMLVPFLSGSSIIFFSLNLDLLAFYALALGSMGQAIMMGYFLNRYKAFYMSVMLAGSISWLTGNLMWLAWKSYPLAAPWWIAFLLLIITGERLELTRFLPIKRYQQKILTGALGIFMLGIIIPFHGNGRYMAGLGLMLTGLWLLKYDMATKSVKREGQHKFSALLLLTGYGWLIACGAMILAGDLYGFIYDAVLHAFFIGFAFSMIFAHGPVILRGVLGLLIKPFHKVLYLPAILLEGSLVLRIVADILSLPLWRKWGGMLNGIAILLYFVLMGTLILREKRKEARRKSFVV